MATCAFLGLGVMGYPMAGHLVAAGHRVTVYNRTTAKAERWVTEHVGVITDAQEHVLGSLGRSAGCRFR